MDDFITVATFESAFDPQFLLAKSILEENEIEYYATNENLRTLEPPYRICLIQHVHRTENSRKKKESKPYVYRNRFSKIHQNCIDSFPSLPQSNMCVSLVRTHRNADIFNMTRRFS